MSAVSTGIQSGLLEWKNGPQPAEWDVLQFQYQERYLLAKGELFIDVWRSNPYKSDPRVYRNISLMWDHVSRVVDFYATMVYQGQLIAEPGMGAIPIKPDKNLSTEQINALMAAIDVQWTKWNWQRQMTYRPRLGAAVGDVLTELVHDTDRRFVFPKSVWPGYVKTIDLDYADNVQAYTLEYKVTEVDDRGNRETFTFRKDVTKESFHYFKNDQPHDYYGEGAEVRNPYGFVPAIWDRHRTDGISVRGNAATDESRQSLFGLNSLFSHSRDFQHKAFFAPIVVAGKISQKDQKSIDLSRPSGDPSAMAESLSFLEGSPESTIHQATFDIGQTLAQLELMRDGILGKHPEATFFEKLAESSQVTGPGANAIILPVRGKVVDARAGYDYNTVHLMQMHLSMSGYHIANGDWDTVEDADGVRRRAELGKSREVFRLYAPGAYENEAMAFSIASRDIIESDLTEIIDNALKVESLETLWGLRQAKVPEDDALQILEDKRERDTLIGDFTPVDEGRDIA